MPLSHHASQAQRLRYALTGAAVACLALVACIAVLSANGLFPEDQPISELNRSGVETNSGQFNVAQVGRYSMRAERQARNFELDSERRVQQATDLDGAARVQSKLSATEETRARHSAYLAADVKSRIQKLLSAGRDQVNRATKFAAKASKLKISAHKLLGQAKAAKQVSNAEDKTYHRLLNKYSVVVDKIHKLTEEGRDILDQVHEAGLKLADLATNYQKAKKGGASAKKIKAIKKKLDVQKKDIAALAQKKVSADADLDKAKLLMDKNQPVITRADRAKYNSVQAYAKYTSLARHANKLSQISTKLQARAESLKELIGTTELTLKQKRKLFWHFKNRAKTEMSIAEKAEDKKEALRRAARRAKSIAGRLEGKAHKIRSLAMNGVNDAMDQDVRDQKQRDAELHDTYKH